MRLIAVLLALSACSSGAPTASPPTAASPPPDAGNDAAAAPAADANANANAADASPPLGSPPSIEDGLLMALQGTPPPQPGQPTPFMLVGCPLHGQVQIHVYVLADDGTKVDAGERVATYSKDGITDHVALGSALTVDVAEKDSFAAAPFVYRATVASDSSFLDTTGHQFVARMLNPASPELDDVGLAFPEKLVRCN